MYKYILIIIISFLFTSCCNKNFDTSTKRVECERVFMNESNRYTFIVNGQPWAILLNFYPYDVNIYYTVPLDKPIYFEYAKHCNGGEAFYTWLKIYLHDVNELNGAGWNHGKFGKGQTSVLQ